ncbi:hypothetical protein EG329_012662 [Mollisiaceae sp. DMI_Dod_QoI]|nr:hypothetical protein EG329_012662 [Helotiales sp. DMI_Dod_QoI]
MAWNVSPDSPFDSRVWPTSSAVSQKTLEQKGESGDTFHAILQYAKDFKPALIILENVLGAPWLDAKIPASKRTKKGCEPQVGIDKHLEQVGYVTVFVRIDSKDYYVPHTRRRGG